MIGGKLARVQLDRGAHGSRSVQLHHLGPALPVHLLPQAAKSSRGATRRHQQRRHRAPPHHRRPGRDHACESQ